MPSGSGFFLQLAAWSRPSCLFPWGGWRTGGGKNLYQNLIAFLICFVLVLSPCINAVIYDNNVTTTIDYWGIYLENQLTTDIQNNILDTTLGVYCPTGFCNIVNNQIKNPNGNSFSGKANLVANPSFLA
jgi:hypothetical protein